MLKIFTGKKKVRKASKGEEDSVNVSDLPTTNEIEEESPLLSDGDLQEKMTQTAEEIVQDWESLKQSSSDLQKEQKMLVILAEELQETKRNIQNANTTKEAVITEQYEIDQEICIAVSFDKKKFEDEVKMKEINLFNKYETSNSLNELKNLVTTIRSRKTTLSKLERLAVNKYLKIKKKKPEKCTSPKQKNKKAKTKKKKIPIKFKFNFNNLNKPDANTSAPDSERGNDVTEVTNMMERMVIITDRQNNVQYQETAL